MKFHLDFQPADPGFRIAHSQKILLLGSCFSENICNKLVDAGFNTLCNPLGIIFNPLSIFDFLGKAVHQVPADKSLFIGQELHWLSFQAHSSIRRDSAAELEQHLNETMLATRTNIENASCIFITPGTAWYYRKKDSGHLVSNCHRQPHAAFTRHLASLQEIAEAGNACLRSLLEINPSLRIIFTISPVKHLRDGVEENFLSKCILRLAIREICRETPNCSYFSSYELVSEDLRDYRFYESDLAHPTQAAIDYVWERFGNTYFDGQTARLARLFEDRSRALRHQHAGSGGDPKFRQHLRQLEESIRNAGGQI